VTHRHPDRQSQLTDSHTGTHTDRQTDRRIQTLLRVLEAAAYGTLNLTFLTN